MYKLNKEGRIHNINCNRNSFTTSQPVNKQNFGDVIWNEGKKEQTHVKGEKLKMKKKITRKNEKS